MVQETVRMSRRESQRATLLAQVEAKAMTLREAAELMDVCYRQAKRMRKRMREEGPLGLAHRLRDRPSNRRTDQSRRQQVIDRYRERYLGFGPTFAQEKLAGDGFVVSVSTLRRWLIAEHLWIARAKRKGAYRRRERRQHFGELVQIDGSDHDWFEGRRGSCCLEVLIDDATGKVWARFGESESLDLAMATLAGWIRRFGGSPQALYADRLSLYHPDRGPNADERKAGSGALSRFGAACWRLGTRMIKAGSPQAKGRVERMNGTLQDRLVKEMRLRDLSSIEAANAFLEGEFLDELNARFAVAPSRATSFVRLLPDDRELEDLLCLEETRQVQNDWTITYGPRVFQILEPASVIAPRQKVLVRQRLDGDIRIVKGDRELRFEDVSYMVRVKTIEVPPPRGWEGKGAPPPNGEKASNRERHQGGLTPPGPSARPPDQRGHF